MLNLVFYFQVHQPYRLRHYNAMEINKNHDYFDHRLNEEVINKVADKCYIPTNALMLKLIQQCKGDFKIAYSITGTVIEQFKKYRPEVLDSFKRLADTGNVEFIGETYYHSLALMYDTNEFLEQVDMHRELIRREFGYDTTTFRNTELIYQDKLSDLIRDTEGFNTILTEGADRILDWRSPLFAYKNYSGNVNLLLKYYKLSDDIAFRFSNRGWAEYPLTVEKFVNWVEQLSLAETKERNLFLNLFMDYETFGEHQWEETGIFKFMEKLPEHILKNPYLSFATPSEAHKLANYQQETLAFPEPVSWADEERDLSAWLENDMQNNAIEAFYELLGKIKAKNRLDLLEEARKLSTSDHFYYMSTKYFQDGDVHKYFSPYDSPEQAYIYYINSLADMEERLND
ncbi:MAG: glycoside hydrolase family 57 protein [Candidatus Cloacimonadales bacterium]|jgi:alpha-amylase|nr:glycoside hydrolase family 57 protein [Candidatus Cloacimonadota bacterium]MDD2650696.1 glycoside hydrolase family 57 protein [Candidatus Cloacimonadota bacterium]MDX9977726.1 glycoside hydrolase family 57 protein [Candidatus Cloacimonadales bacterium]